MVGTEIRFKFFIIVSTVWQVRHNAELQEKFHGCRTEAGVFGWTVQLELQTSAEITEGNTFLVKFILSV